MVDSGVFYSVLLHLTYSIFSFPGCLVSATGLVVVPYLEYPQLLPTMLELLGKGAAGSVPWSLRREIMRTIGERERQHCTLFYTITLVHTHTSLSCAQRQSCAVNLSRIVCLQA